MPKRTPEEAAARWRESLGRAPARYRDGVNAVKTAPGEAAAAAQDRMMEGFRRAVESGLWARRVSGVSLSDWQKAAINKGAERLASGAAAAEGKVAARYRQLFPIIQRLQDEVRNMPKGNIEDSIARMRTFVVGMHEARDEIS